jgi:hypothetical protein
MGAGLAPPPDGGTRALPDAVGDDAPKELEDRLFAAMSGEL